MPASTTTAIKPFVQPHVHFAGQTTCPYCDQPIPEEKCEEISGRIEARARAHVSEAAAVLREQYARERAQAEAKAKADLEQARKDAATEINGQRELLDKDKLAAVNAERANGLAVRMKLEEQLADMQRQLQQKTAHEHGEGDELDLFEVLKAAFEGDRIRRVEKGSPGADVIHEVVENGKVVGKIVYDRKNRGKWATEYATKLRDDQIAEKADHAILSTNKFPKGKRELCVYEHVILARPARVLALAEILRAEIVQHHALRISNEQREVKMAELYRFITSPHCRQLLDAIETLVAQLEQIEADEQKAHNNVWQKRGRLLKAVLKSNGDLRFQIGRVVGTVDALV